MAKDGGTQSVNVPEFKAPDPNDFITPFGNAIFSNGAFRLEGFNTPAKMEMDALRSSILKEIGVTTPEREKSLNEFQDTFFKEASRVALPKLENALFDRGLGGSSVYQGAVTDLLSNLATDSVLQREKLASNDVAEQINVLSTIGNLQAQDKNFITNLLRLASTDATNREQLATSRYNKTIPLKSTIEGKKKDNKGQMIGTLVGLAGGAALGNPALGASIGGTVGGAF